MGEVYRARDMKLGRDVALKILPGPLANHPDRVTRFEREARMLASFNHRHIGAIYGLEDADGVRALILELVEGETLAERLARRPVLLADALAIARQLADALDAAHEKGIVHRDLKPANIKITPDGVVKVLDFGLAKAAAGDASPDMTQAATVSVGGTLQGVIVGTVAYMSPEQARGQAVDKRTDIWAFGCVLFEMLAGRPLFGGATLSDTLVAVLEREPEWTALPPETPESVVRVLHRCLEKDLRRRLRDIGDARAELEVSPGPMIAGQRTTGRRSSRLPWGVAAAASLVAAVIATTAWRQANSGEGAAVAPAFSRIVPITAGPAREFGPVLSPDGKWVAYVSDAGRLAERLGQVPGRWRRGQPYFGCRVGRVGFVADQRARDLARRQPDRRAGKDEGKLRGVRHVGDTRAPARCAAPAARSGLPGDALVAGRDPDDIHPGGRHGRRRDPGG